MHEVTNLGLGDPSYSFSSTLLFFVSASNHGRLIAAGQDQDVWVLLYKGGERQGWMCA